MALNNSWMLLAGLGLFAVIAFATVFFISKRKPKPGSSTNVANLSRLTMLPEYQASQRKYKLGLGVGAFLLTLLIAGAMVISSQPVTVSTASQTKYNRDIVLCLDVSGSMIDVDVELVEKFQALTQEFKGERISLVIWNSKSFMVFPLTDDYDYIKTNLDKVRNGLAPIDPSVSGPTQPGEAFDILSYTVDSSTNGSLIGDGLTACTLGFDQEDSQDTRSKSIILATDNVVNGEQIISFDEAVKYATENNVTIYGIKPFTGYEAGKEDEEMKTAIEDINKGKYYTLTDPSAISEIVNQISQEEVTAIQSDPMLVKTPSPQIWIGVAGIIVAGFLVLAWRLRL